MRPDFHYPERIHEALEVVARGGKPDHMRMATLRRRRLVEDVLVFEHGEVSLRELARMSVTARAGLGRKLDVRLRLSGWGCAVVGARRGNQPLPPRL